MPDARAIIRHQLDIWSCTELADALEITTDTLRIWRSQGQGPAFVKAGRTVFYRIEDVKAWLASNRYQRINPSTPDSSDDSEATEEIPVTVTTTYPPLPPMQEQHPREPIGVAS